MCVLFSLIRLLGFPCLLLFLCASSCLWRWTFNYISCHINRIFLGLKWNHWMRKSSTLEEFWLRLPIFLQRHQENAKFFSLVLANNNSNFQHSAVNLGLQMDGIRVYWTAIEGLVQEMLMWSLLSSLSSFSACVPPSLSFLPLPFNHSSFSSSFFFSSFNIDDQTFNVFHIDFTQSVYLHF